MGQPVLLTADRAREVLDFVDQRKGRPQNTTPYPRKWPILTGNTVPVIRSTSITPNANGYSPALVQLYDPNAKTWTDGIACQANGLYGEQLNPGRYVAVPQGATSDGTPTYLAVDVAEVVYDDNSNSIPLTLVFQFAKLDFVVSSPQANVAKIRTLGTTGTINQNIGPYATSVICSNGAIITTYRSQTYQVVLQDGLVQTMTLTAPQ